MGGGKKNQNNLIKVEVMYKLSLLENILSIAVVCEFKLLVQYKYTHSKACIYVVY